MTTDGEFNDDITQVSPNDLSTDEVVNTISAELQANIKYLLNLISATNINGTKQGSENILNYDNNGNKTSSNGGTFNTFENKNSWTAVENTVVVNDSTISNTVNNLLVYNGIASTIESQTDSNSWIEREFYIAPELRGGSFVFAIKGTGLSSIPTNSDADTIEFSYCNSSTVGGISAVSISGTCQSRYEDVVIEVKGAIVDTVNAKTLGPWPQFLQYNQIVDVNPAYRTVYIPFNIGLNTSSVKIKIFRTRLDGAIAISNMVLIALPIPYDNYDFKNVDINQFYDFKNNILKVNSTTVNGRHVAANYSNKLNELLTKEQILHLMQYNKDIQFDWDAISGPRLIELNNDTDDSPKVSAFEFDPGFTRYLHFNMKSNGPTPGICCLGFNYFITENEFSETITCETSEIVTSENVQFPALDCTQYDGSCYETNINLRTPYDVNNYCKNIKFDVYFKTINPGEPGNPDITSFNKLSYIVAIPQNLITDGNLGYFEIYYDFFKDLKNVRGAITLFTISRDGLSVLDTFNGNFLVGQTTLSVCNPPDDIPETGSYTIAPSEC